jgi:hypothetical protein
MRDRREVIATSFAGLAPAGDHDILQADFSQR